MIQATLTSSRGIKATEAIIKHLEAVDKPPDDDDLKKECFDDITLFDVTKDETVIGGGKGDDDEADSFQFGKL